MNDPLNLLKSLTRPTLLVTAARHAAQGYQRDRVLRRLLKANTPTGHGEAVIKLLILERELDEARRTRIAGYSVARHITVLAALIAEGGYLGNRARPAQANASATSALRLVM